MLTELHAAWARITKHPSKRDFEEASWPDICQEFERRFSHGLPNVAPASRVHLQQIWLECVWNNRDNMVEE